MRRLNLTDQLVVVLQKIFDKQSAKGLARCLQQNGVDLATFNLFAKSFSQALIKDLKKRNYNFDIVREIEITRNGKKRLVYLSCFIDKIMQTYLAAILTNVLHQKLTPHCYAYVAGKNNFLALHHFSNYLRRIKNDDVYVVRTDIAHYFDSIPVHQQSLLWIMLDDLCSDLSVAVQDSAYLMDLLKCALRPIINTKENSCYQKRIGVPTGMPLVTVAANLYLHQIDQQLAAIPGLFYARYCDDILLAHSDVATLSAADKLLTEQLLHYGLERQQSKDQYIYFTRAGRAHGDPSLWQGSNKIEYLGLAINRQGNTTFAAKQLQRIRIRFYNRISNCCDLLTDATVDEKCQCLCQMIKQMVVDKNNIYDGVSSDVGASSDFHDVQLVKLLRSCDDRGALKQLDFFIARTIAEKISGKKGMLAFRHIPYAKLRRHYGLVSLVAMKNQL